MNSTLTKIFTYWYTPETTDNKVHGASSINGTTGIRVKIVKLFQDHNIKSIFDAGCNDCNWMKLVSQHVDYQGGDISLPMINGVKQEYPELNVIHHDVTTDPIPSVDLLFVRDVAIHLNNQDKQNLCKNWINSNIPWILITHNRETLKNTDFQYGTEFPFSSTNWEIAPWSFPAPVDALDEYGPGGRCMALWHRDQIKGIL